MNEVLIVGSIDVERESGLYVNVAHPGGNMLLRGCAFITPYRAGFEDAEYGRVYANPFRTGSVKWSQYDQGNEDARKAKKQRSVHSAVEGEMG